MKNSELRIVLDSLVRMQVEMKNIFTTLSEKSEIDVDGLYYGDICVARAIKNIVKEIACQCEECETVNDTHDEKCSIGRQIEAENAERLYDEKKESQWIESQQITRGKI